MVISFSHLQSGSNTGESRCVCYPLLLARL